jgi:CHAT domain-containing protein
MTARFIMRNGANPHDLPRLSASGREAAGILRLFAARFGSDSVEHLDGLDATRERVLSLNLAKFRYIHIASHGTIDTEIPQLSALILGKYGRTGPVESQQIWVDDLLGQTFDADVVVLSACDTSLGPDFAGEGPIGLRYAVLARGARSVVSSLWPVSDEITADLMAEMYVGLLKDAHSTKSALAVAMRRLLEKRPTLDPALWAAYSVVEVNRGK